MVISRKGLRIITALIAAVICALCIAFSSAAPKAQALVHNSRFKNCKKLYGIDVSKWQTTIDWKKVAADGIDFVIIRMGYSDRQTGVHCTDETFWTNYKGAKAAGLKVGVYYYSTAITKAEAVSEGKYVLSVLGGTKLDLPVYFDQECVEGRVVPSKITTSSMTQFALGFLETVTAGGYQAGYYSYISWIYSEIDASQIEKTYPMWIANVTNETKYEGIYNMWQYSFTGKVNGIPTAVDRDVLYLPADPPAKVTGLKATLSGNKATLSWSKVSNADGYYLYRTVNGNTEMIAELDSATTSFTVDATPVEAKYAVSAYVYSIMLTEGAASDSVSVKADVPYNLTSKNGLNYITLSWQPLKNAAGYIVYFDKGNGSYTWAGKTTTTSLKIKNLKSATKYNLAVKAYFNADGSSNYVEGSSTLSAVSSTHHTGTQNVQATNLTLKTNGTTSQTIKWTAPSGSVDGYRVYFYDTETGSYKRAAQVTKTTATITGLTPGCEYNFMVRSFYNTADTMVLSQYSDLLTTNTQSTKVTNIKTTARTNNSLTLSWSMGAQGEAEGYRIYSYDKSTKKYTRLAQTTAKSYKFTGLKQGCEYTYLIRSFYKTSVGGVILSQYCDLYTTGTMATKATNLKVKANSKLYQTISWTIPSNQRVDGSRLYSYNTSTKKYTRLCDVTTNSFKVTGLKAGTEYHYLVRTYYKAGSEYILSDYSALLDCATSPAAPANLKSSNVTAASVKLTWDKVSGANGYNVYRVDADGKTTVVKGTTGNTVTLKNLTKNTKYTYMVRAYKKSGGVKYLGFASKKLGVTTSK